MAAKKNYTEAEMMDEFGLTRLKNIGRGYYSARGRLNKLQCQTDKAPIIHGIGICMVYARNSWLKYGNMASFMNGCLSNVSLTSGCLSTTNLTSSCAVKYAVCLNYIECSCLKYGIVETCVWLNVVGSEEQRSAFRSCLYFRGRMLLPKSKSLNA